MHSVVHEASGGPYEMSKRAMDVLKAPATPSGEYLIGRRSKRRSKYRPGDQIKLSDPESPFCGLTAQVLTVTGNCGIMQAVLKGEQNKNIKLTLKQPVIAELVREDPPKK